MRGAEDWLSSPTLTSLSMARGLAAVPRGGAGWMIERKGEERREDQQLRCDGETLFAGGKPNKRSIPRKQIYTYTATRRARPRLAFVSSPTRTLHP